MFQLSGFYYNSAKRPGGAQWQASAMEAGRARSSPSMSRPAGVALVQVSDFLDLNPNLV